MKSVYVGSDHAGYATKRLVLAHLRENFPKITFEDCGTYNEESTDYPRYAKDVADKVVQEKARGILVCGSGIGMCIAANKVHGIRAAQVWDATSARLCREHNDANILCVGARLVGIEVIFEACRTWLTTEFLGGRHQKRVELIHKLEENS